MEKRLQTPRCDCDSAVQHPKTRRLPEIQSPVRESQAARPPSRRAPPGLLIPPEARKVAARQAPRHGHPTVYGLDGETLGSGAQGHCFCFLQEKTACGDDEATVCSFTLS